MVSLGVIKNVLNLIMVMVSQFCEYTKSHWTVYFLFLFFFFGHTLWHVGSQSPDQASNSSIGSAGS